MRCLPKVVWLIGVAVFALCAWFGYLLGAKPSAHASITIDFYGFDAEGNRVGAQDEHTARLNTEPPYEITRQVGAHETLIFTPDDITHYQVKVEQVTWTDKETYRRWLEQTETGLKQRTPSRSAFWDKIFRGYHASMDRPEKNKFEYPVIFEKKR